MERAPSKTAMSKQDRWGSRNWSPSWRPSFTLSTVSSPPAGTSWCERNNVCDACSGGPNVRPCKRKRPVTRKPCNRPGRFRVCFPARSLSRPGGRLGRGVDIGIRRACPSAALNPPLTTRGNAKWAQCSRSRRLHCYASGGQSDGHGRTPERNIGTYSVNPYTRHVIECVPKKLLADACWVIGTQLLAAPVGKVPACVRWKHLLVP